jgi:hypothetical protein
MKPVLRCVVLLAVASSLWAQSQSPPVVKSAPLPQIATFPGFKNRVLSPDGHFAVTQDREEMRDAGARFLRLHDLRTGESGLLFRFARNVEVSWAPDSRSLFITDNKAVDESQAYVFFPDRRRILNVGKKILDAYPDDIKFAKSDHAYIRAVRWLSATELLATLTGHGEDGAAGFTVCYIVDVSRAIRRTAEYYEEGHPCPY